MFPPKWMVYNGKPYAWVPWEPKTFIFRGYNPYIGGLKPSFSWFWGPRVHGIISMNHIPKSFFGGLALGLGYIPLNFPLGEAIDCHPSELRFVGLPGELQSCSLQQAGIYPSRLSGCETFTPKNYSFYHNLPHCN